MKRGFSLAEVIIALAILAGVMAALLMAFTMSLGGAKNVEEASLALEIADSTMEQLKNTSYADLQNFTKDSETIYKGVTGYSVRVTTTKPEDPARVDVTVSWTGKTSASSLTLTTLAANY